MWTRPESTHKEFEENLLAHMDSLYNFAYRLTRNREDAADLVQEASLRAHRYYHRFEPGTNFKAWILTILRNMFISQYRKRRREPPHVVYEEVEEIVSAPAVNGFEEEIFSETLQKSVDDLPEELRMSIVLCYVEELSYKEIAQVMNCPIGTVMSRLFIARQLLKKKLCRAISKEGKPRL